MADGEPVEVTQEEFEKALAEDIGSVGPAMADASLSETTTDESIGGEGEDAVKAVETIVNTGVKLIELINCHASISGSQFAKAVPGGASEYEVVDWADEVVKLTLPWKASSAWWKIWDADYDFTVGLAYRYGGKWKGHGLYLDAVSAFVDVAYLPPDFNVDVKVTLPDHARNAGSSATDPIAALDLRMTITLNAIFGHKVYFSQNYDGSVQGNRKGYLSAI
ncbi:MAG TPA: hypothetical protein VFH56_06580 [Acidimicrobiales bacterium]|nr:hypothetical protein [Acidimicrobiales bacterium]